MQLGAATEEEAGYDAGDSEPNSLSSSNSLGSLTVPADLAQLPSQELERLIRDVQSSRSEDKQRSSCLLQKQGSHFWYAEQAENKYQESSKRIEEHDVNIHKLEQELQQRKANSMGTAAENVVNHAAGAKSHPSSNSKTSSKPGRVLSRPPPEPVNLASARLDEDAEEFKMPPSFFDKDVDMNGGYNMIQGRVPALPNTPITKASLFTPPAAGSVPKDLCVHEIPKSEKAKSLMKRISRRTAPRDEILIYVDGSCLDQNDANDANTRRAGCAFVHAIGSPDHADGFGVVSFRLEAQGPSGEQHPQTSNRAELRAANAAFELRIWGGEGFSKVTIASDSAYLVNGITNHIAKWQQRDWERRQPTSRWRTGKCGNGC